MKIDISDKELQTLIQAVFIAGWISESSENPDREAIEALEQKVYRLAHQAGQTDLVEYDDDLGQFFVCPDQEEAWVEDFIAPHDDEHLWESLQMELARRDFAQAHTPAAIEAMDDEERMDKLAGLMRKYSKEFGTSGLERLVIKE